MCDICQDLHVERSRKKHTKHKALPFTHLTKHKALPFTHLQGAQFDTCLQTYPRVYVCVCMDQA